MRILLATLFIPMSLIAASPFGTAGSSGMEGASGYDGQNGRNVTLFATGQNETLDLSGTSATDGRSGEQGQAAWGCMQPVGVSEDLYGANGGNGGSGGAGGRGGNGGDLTAYFTEVTNLKYVYVRSTPGRGGYGGYGAYGGEGCYCSTSQWTVAQPDGTSIAYSCTNGSGGSNGYPGGNGGNGKQGAITLIHSATDLPPEAASLRIPTEGLLAQTYTLLKHQWEERTGARALFASGSDITDKYHSYTGTIRRAIRFLWAEPRPLSDFKGKRISVELKGTEVSFNSPDALWFSGSSSAPSAESLLFNFEHVLLQKEAMNLSLGKLVGMGGETELSVVDGAKASGFVHTDFTLHYYTKALVLYYQRWTGKVPATAIVASDDGFRIDVGRLGISEKFLSKNTRALIGLSIHRSLGNGDDTKYWEKYYIIGGQ